MVHRHGGEEEDAAFIRVLMDKVKLNGPDYEPESIIASFNKKGGKEIYEMDNREESALRSIARQSLTDGVNDAPFLFYGKASAFHIMPHLNKIISYCRVGFTVIPIHEHQPQ